MKQDPQVEVTALLQAWSAGDLHAAEEFAPVVYSELRRLARRLMSQERHALTVESGALVNEAFLRLYNWRGVDWKSRAHFIGVSAQIMRRILVDHARKRASLKRGAGAQQTTLKDAMRVMPEINPDLIDLNNALQELERLDSRKARVVEMMFFGNAQMQEIAEALNVSELTVIRDWKFARTWLHKELTKHPA